LIRRVVVFETGCQLNGRIVGAGDPVHGEVRWSPVKSIWFTVMLGAWLGLGVSHFSFGALLLFLGTSAVTLCGGHSLGMHRRLIHRSFDCPLWLEWLGVYLSTLVGLGGPFTMMRTHDLRDWAQREAACHDYFGHRQPMLRDFWWQVHCELRLTAPPEYCFPTALRESRFYQILQRTSMMQQLPWVILFFAIGGWGWVAWGMCARVCVSIFGHWLIGHVAHGHEGSDWQVEGASVQGRNVPLCGLITFGECWHNNHHAFPGSAQIGLAKGQSDPGWWTLLALERLGLVWSVKRASDLPHRPNLISVCAQSQSAISHRA
jgi:sn-1 stearoyl-lipid 9-desaturase